MLRNFNKTFVFFIVLIVGLATLNSCKETTTTEPVKTKLSKVTKLMAFSANQTSVGLKWTLSASENVNDFEGYLIKVLTTGNQLVKSQTVTKGKDTALITGLTNGVIYNFEVIVKAKSNSTSFSDSDPEKIQWSPAWRFETEGTIPIQVYESSSSVGYPSGLIFYHPTSQGPKTVSLLSADSSLIDVYLYTVPNTNHVALRSSHLYRSTRKITRFSTIYYDVNSLNDPRVAPPDTATYTKFEWQIDSVAVTTSRVFYFKGNNGNYGRILVMRNPNNGTLIWGTSPEQYLRVQISYQSVPYNRFSKK